VCVAIEIPALAHRRFWISDKTIDT